ncbi:MAG: hypothetical protein QXJ07_00925 [Candidatus Bathyarchaeia archaeon]
MSAVLQKRAPGIVTPTAQMKGLNAESVTAITIGFLRRIGHKGEIKPRRVSLEEGIYTVEVEMKKLTAIIHVNAETQEITSYEIQPKGEEGSVTSFSPKIILLVFGLATAINVALHFTFKMFGL